MGCNFERGRSKYIMVMCGNLGKGDTLIKFDKYIIYASHILLSGYKSVSGYELVYHRV